MTFRIKKLIYHSEIFLVSVDKLTIRMFKVLVEVRPDLQFQLCVRFHRIWPKSLKICAKQIGSPSAIRCQGDKFRSSVH